MADIEAEDFYESMPLYDVWTMKDGSEIEVKDMKTSHIHNCIKILERTHPEMPFMLGDEAEYYAEIEYENQVENTQTWLEIFKDELKSRESESVGGK